MLSRKAPGVVTSKLASKTFAALIMAVAAFQLALALGAPWGEFAMGGAFPGSYPPAMRIGALVQMGLLVASGLVILCRAGLVLPRWRGASRWLAWVVVVLFGAGAVLNLITPSALERALWALVAICLFVMALRVALSRGRSPPSLGS